MRLAGSVARHVKLDRGAPLVDVDALFSSSAAIEKAQICEAIYYPLGFPVKVRSNSRAILAAAEQSWRNSGPVFLHTPLEITIAVTRRGTGGRDLPAAPEFRLNESLLVQSSDRDNFILANLANGRAAGLVTEATAECTLFLRYYFLESAALSMIATLRAVALHAGCVRSGDTGILLCGDSGAGKSSLAFACARAGFTYICDDASYMPFDRDDRLVVGNCHQVRFRPSAAELFPEVEGRAITPRAAGKPSIEAPLSDWPHLSTATIANIEHIVFLNRNAGPAHELIPKSATEAQAWFRQHLLAAKPEGDAREAALTRLIEARVWELRYGSLSWATERLKQLAAGGR
jgi:hypothetical protein